MFREGLRAKAAPGDFTWKGDNPQQPVDHLLPNKLRLGVLMDVGVYSFQDNFVVLKDCRVCTKLNEIWSRWFIKFERKRKLAEAIQFFFWETSGTVRTKVFGLICAGRLVTTYKLANVQLLEQIMFFFCNCDLIKLEKLSREKIVSEKLASCSLWRPSLTNSGSST